MVVCYTSPQNIQKEYESQMTAAFWGVHQAVWQEHFDISEQLAASFIYLDDGDQKFL